MFRRIITELRYTDTFYQRMFLATASTLYGVASLNWLGLLFGVVSIGAWWRLLDRRPRVWLGTLVNLCVAILWITITAANMVKGQMPSDNVAELMICITALFALTRTDLTATDKGTA